MSFKCAHADFPQVVSSASEDSLGPTILSLTRSGTRTQSPRAQHALAPRAREAHQYARAAHAGRE